MTVLTLILILAWLLVFKFVYDANKHYGWFISLKPDDKILVRIYSQDCECTQNATVTKSHKGKYVEAKIDECTINKCKEGDRVNDSCLYNVTSFHMKDIAKVNYFSYSQDIDKWFKKYLRTKL